MALTKVKTSMIADTLISVKNYGAVGDGVTDDTAAIRAAIADSNSLYFPSGTYMVDPDVGSGEIFYIENQDSFFISGYGATIKNVAGAGLYGAETFQFRNCDNVTVEGLTIDCNKQNQTGGYNAIGIYGGENITIRDCILLNAKQDGIYVRSDNVTVQGNYPNNVLIDNVYIDNANRNGISVIGCQSITITNSTLINTGGEAPGAGIDFEPNSVDIYGIKNAIVSNCIFENNDGSGVVVTGSSATNPGETPWVLNIMIDNIICKDNGAAALGAGSSCDVLIARAGSAVLNGYSCNSNVDWGRNGLVHVANGVENASLSNLYFKDIQHTDTNKVLVYIDSHSENIRTVSNVYAYNCNVNVVQGGAKASFDGIYAEDCGGIPMSGDEVTIKNATLIRCDGLTSTSSSTISDVTIIDSTATYPLRARGKGSSYQNITIQNTGTASGYAVWLDKAVTADPTDDLLDCLLDGFYINDIGGYWDTPSNAYYIDQTSLATNKIRNMIPSPLGGSTTWDPASIASGGSASTTVSLLRGDVGDRCVTTHSVSLQGLISFASVTSANTATVTLFNPTGGAIDLASHTVTVEAIK